jgi:hypothetical protein
MLGWVVVRNTQPMPLTSWPAGNFPSLRQVPNGDCQFATHKIATPPQRWRYFAGKNSRQARLGGVTKHSAHAAHLVACW